MSKVSSTNVKQRSEKYPEETFHESDVTFFFCYFLCSSNDTIDFKQKASCDKHRERYSCKRKMQAVQSTVGKTT